MYCYMYNDDLFPICIGPVNAGTSRYVRDMKDGHRSENDVSSDVGERASFVQDFTNAIPRRCSVQRKYLDLPDNAVAVN